MEFAPDKLESAASALKLAGEKFAQAESGWQTARDANVTAQWGFHNAILGAKRQIVAQYGDDSDEAQASSASEVTATTCVEHKAALGNRGGSLLNRDSSWRASVVGEGADHGTRGRVLSPPKLN